MPGLITHYICANAVLSGLNGELKNIIWRNRPLYNIGAQGPDVFFYYLPGILRKKTRGLGSKMHNGGFRNFTEHMGKEIKEMDSFDDRMAAIAYFCGFLTHYALDCSAHPYIYYKSGFKRKDEASSKMKYSVYHRNLETAIDVLILKIMSGGKPSEKKLWELIYTKRKKASTVAELLSRSIFTAYGVEISGKQIAGAMSHMAFATRLLQSRKGKRKHFLEIVEGMTVGERIVSSVIHTDELEEGLDYLNLRKKPWSVPWDNTVTQNNSFTELFDNAVENATIMLEAFYSFFIGNTTLDELLLITGNYSFSSGMDSEAEIKFLHHDIIFE